MQLILPDVLAEGRGLPVAICATGLALGFLLWVFGWWGHRFWIVLFTTVVAGIAGLSSARLTGMQPFVAGLLLAVTAGVLALPLSRVIAFVAGGLAVLLVVRSLVPSWDEPLLCFLLGGLVGLVLFRAWTMALTSLGGTLIMAYSGLLLADKLHKVDALGWTEQRALLLNWGCVGVATFGFGVQFFLERGRIRRAREREEEARRKEAEKKQKEKEREEKAKIKPKKKPWWQQLVRAA